MPKLATQFTTPGLPLARNTRTILEADAGLLAWITPDTAYCDLSGAEITAFHDRLGKPVSYAATSARATLVDAMLGGFQGARLVSNQSTTVNDYGSSGLTLAQDAAATMAMIIIPRLVGVTQAICGRYTDSSNRILISQMNTNTLRFFAKNQFATTAATVAIGTPELVIGSFNGSTGLKIWHRGATVAGTSTGGTTDSGALGIGTLDPGNAFQGFNGDILEHWVFNRDILAVANDTSFSAIVDLAAQKYGVVVA